MEYTETHQRVTELLKLVTLPCELSLQQIAVVIGSTKYKVRCALDDLNGIEVKFTPGSGRSKSLFEAVKPQGGGKAVKCHKAIPQKAELPQRNMYGSCVWLSDKEYEKLLDIMGNEHNRDLAIEILSAWKEKQKQSETRIGDMRHFFGWVKNIIMEKEEKRKAHEEQRKNASYFREEQNIANEKRIEEMNKNAITREQYLAIKQEYLKNHTEEEFYAYMEQKRKTNNK